MLHTNIVDMRNPSIINYELLLSYIAEFAKKTGRIATRPVILLYYVMKSKDTPMADKIMLASAIAYVVLPIDLLSAKRIPILGWIDEIVSLTVAYQKVRSHVTPEMEAKADQLLDKWFGQEYTSYSVVD